MSFVKHYKLKIKILSPVHIGSGEIYEPTGYVIEKILQPSGKERDALYEFDTMALYEILSETDKEKFRDLVETSDENGLIKMQNFIFAHKKQGRQVAYKIVKVSPNAAQEYYDKIGKVVQKESGKNNVINQLEIYKCVSNKNQKRDSAILTGSSLKGAISTAYQELLVKKGVKYHDVRDLLLSPSDGNPFKNLLISDSGGLASKIYSTANVKRELKNDDIKYNDSLSTRLEAIVSNVTCEIPLSIKQNSAEEPLDINRLIKACNDHYEPIFRSLFNDDGVLECLSEKFYKSYKDFGRSNLAPNQFLLRVGRHSGARAVTIEGEREISIKQGVGKNPIIKEAETTTWLAKVKDQIEAGCVPFGWLLCEINEIKS